MDRLDYLTGAFRVSQLFHAAAVLGVCDAIGGESLSADAIAERTKCDERSLRRLLRALVAIDVLSIDDSQQFRCTEMGQLLRADSPSSMASFAVGRMRDELWRAWGALADGVRTNRVAYEVANASSFWGDLEKSEEDARSFNEMMASRTTRYARSLAGQLDLSEASEIVDVGGGIGTLLADLLVRHPGPRGVLFDRPAGLVGAEAFLQAHGVASRVQLVSGDFFVSVPPTDGLVILRRVLHDWQDEEAAAILARCRDAMSLDARLLVSELLMPELDAVTSADEASCVMDMHMFVLFGAMERSESDYSHLFEQAGFLIERVLPTVPEPTMIARPVS